MKVIVSERYPSPSLTQHGLERASFSEMVLAYAANQCFF
jgi:hypothetical protein